MSVVSTVQFVRVYVWVSLIKARSPGHAALSIGDAIYPSEGYVSFAPAVSGSISGAGKFYDRNHDTSYYARRGVWIGTIYGLDTAAMLHAISKEVASPPAYGAFNECATTVRRILKIGGGDTHASWWSSWNTHPISPDDVEDYASSIVDNTKTIGSSAVRIRGEGTIGR
jgi:hypothetical protein